MFDGKFRAPIDRAVKPIGNVLRKTGLTPDHLTIVGIVVAVGAAVAIGFGELRLGLVLVVCAALPDLFDGALAKASNSSSQRGAYFDSVVDRVTDAMLFGGVAWYLASHDSPHMSILPFAVMALSSVISNTPPRGSRSRRRFNCGCSDARIRRTRSRVPAISWATTAELVSTPSTTPFRMSSAMSVVTPS